MPSKDAGLSDEELRTIVRGALLSVGITGDEVLTASEANLMTTAATAIARAAYNAALEAAAAECEKASDENGYKSYRTGNPEAQACYTTASQTASALATAIRALRGGKE